MRVAARVAVRGRQSGTSLALRVRASTNAFGSALPSVVAARGWEGAWAQHCTPWDAGRAAPALTHLLASEALPPGPVLVPGCGAGWDALACAAAGRPTLGIDLSATAVARCRERQAADVRTRGLPPSALDFRVADFFAFAPRQPFSVVWDYTFMSALRSDAWPRWAATMWRLVAPQGELVTLIFPVGDFAGGPPFAAQPLAVRSLLEGAGFECAELGPVPPELSHPARAGREYLGRWRHDTRRYPVAGATLRAQRRADG